MSDAHQNLPDNQQGTESSFDSLVQGGGTNQAGEFTVAFRGYDKTEVDAALADLTAQLEGARQQIVATQTEKQDAVARLQSEVERLRSTSRSAEQLQAEVLAKNAQLADAEEQIAALGAQLVEQPIDDDTEVGINTREKFEAVLRVAEEQASTLIQNATIQAERLLEAARDESASQRADAKAEAARIVAQAQHDADQIRLTIDTEYTAHEATLKREAAHASEKIAQAEREAEALRTEAEKGAASLRALVTRETTEQRAEAEREVREMNARALEFEETLTRRQDDAQQEFLVLHNKAVAHAERITADANEQVNSALDNAKIISTKADEYEKLMRAQALQIEADARVRAQETLGRARDKARKIVSAVTEHTNMVVRDAEDRARDLRWQQQQLNSFMAEVRELVRPEGVFTKESDDPETGVPGIDEDDASDDTGQIPIVKKVDNGD